MNKFWEQKSLQELSQNEWEALCDGCGKCCLNKLEDEDSGEIFFTDVACAYLDLTTARCKDYSNRKRNVPACMHLQVNELDTLRWLPATCAYRLRSEGKALPAWHPLVTGAADSTVRAGESVVGRVISEEYVHEEELEERVVHWVL